MYLKIFIIYLLILNLIGLFLFYSDKQRAIRHRFRIPEARLFLTALAGGALGCLLGMWLFRHKTKHAAFVIGMPLILILWVVIVLLLLRCSTLSGAWIQTFFHNLRI